MKTKILVAVLANFLVVGAASADQFLTKADERNNIVSPGAPEVFAGGDTCATAPNINALPFSDSGTTVGATNTVAALQAGCSDYTAVNGPDQIYTFTTTAGASVAITLTPTTATYDPAIYVLSTCGTGTTCVTGSDSTLGGAAETINAFAFAPGTYGLYVDSFYAAGAGCGGQGGALCGDGAYDISVTG
ncbi:hypothetical protein, partial [Dokdonella sp.]|uniref:hypothetical protein n=1 Tax=Dokdonella sp. TaxID=2291710 RepID=UPI003C5EA8C0